MLPLVLGFLGAQAASSALEGSVGLLYGTHALGHCTSSVISLLIFWCPSTKLPATIMLAQLWGQSSPLAIFLFPTRTGLTTLVERMGIATGPVGSGSYLLLYPLLERATANSLSRDSHSLVGSVL